MAAIRQTGGRLAGCSNLCQVNAELFAQQRVAAIYAGNSFDQFLQSFRSISVKRYSLPGNRIKHATKITAAIECRRSYYVFGCLQHLYIG